MATQEQLISVSSELHSISEIIKTCHEIALALIEVNKNVSYAGAIWVLIIPTEYDRARKQVITKCSSTLRGLKYIRRTALSSDAIRATTLLKRVSKCCRKCPAENLNDMSGLNGFRCFAKSASENITGHGFRFRLDRKG